nr:MAG TPA: hypothetical protein [Caudoviricetes sp.]
MEVNLSRWRERLKSDAGVAFEAKFNKYLIFIYPNVLTSGHLEKTASKRSTSAVFKCDDVVAFAAEISKTKVPTSELLQKAV